MSTGPSGYGGVPGYEFEVPRGPRHGDGQDSLRRYGRGQPPGRTVPGRVISGRPVQRGEWQGAEWERTEWERTEWERTEWQGAEWEPVHLAPPAGPPADASSPANIVGGIFAVMRARNWVMGLAVPI